MYATTAAERMAVRVDQTLGNSYITLLGFPVKVVSEKRPQVYSDVLYEVYHLIGARNVATGSFQAMCSRGTAHINHTMAQMPSYVVIGMQVDWYDIFPLSSFRTYRYSAIAAIGLAPNEVHHGRIP